jgi:outer membrane protein OmpA-like peptidoglycan-associated protein
MGLTAAEAFMLMCFIMLLLLGLWRQDAEEQTADLERFASGLTAGQREAALLHRDRLTQLDAVIKELEAFKPVLDAAGSPADVLKAMELEKRLGDTLPDDVEKRVRLLDREIVEQLAEAAALMPEKELRNLIDLTSLGEIPSIQQVEGNEEEIARLAGELAAYTQSGMTPQDLAAINTMRATAGRTGAEIAAAIRAQAGDIIAGFGGRILENGNVIFPDSVLFAQGSDVIRPEFDRVLAAFCRPWFEILYNVDQSLRSVQIEGHASSDWRNDSPRVAFQKNLDLSQRRAGAVFNRCLDYGGTDAVGAWAKARMAAVGYSSSRLVIHDGTEDPVRSRRVVFAIDTRTANEAIAEGREPVPTIE